MKPIQKASVCGLGKLGACIAATLAQRGFEVVGIDIDAEKVKKINAGQPPVEEPLLAETITAGKARLRATQDYHEAVATDVTFFIPPSPSLPDGSFSNEFLLRAMQPIAAAVREKGKQGHLFVCSSTTTPGAVDTVLIPMLEREIGGACGRDFGVCYNPEFIALGNVVKGLLEPDMVLIGQSDPQSGEVLEAMYKKYNQNQPNIARMSIISAELTKISVNSYVTMKISFTNQLRMIADQFPKADIHHILDAIGSDSRVGRKYLRAGLSYGGPCFPRDNRLLAYTARQLGLEAPLAEASDKVNHRANAALFEQVQKLVGKSDTVAVLGLTYKPDTYITEEAAGLFLAQQLKRHGYKVVVHDYGARPDIAPSVHEFDHLADPAVLQGRADIKLAVICCPWPQYRSVKFAPTTKVLSPWKL
ncbi:MAG TPA: nucleotide sugar dehydrogenase [Verrucomicrobiota bacterium]|nr:nucleotide sugar dehydrogenase [Verrucomicrobiota bacterium]HQL78664.1 nucleotide sugar dehydrogenase [Verrucomicrobiota bacterium]